MSVAGCVFRRRGEGVYTVTFTLDRVPREDDFSRRDVSIEPLLTHSGVVRQLHSINPECFELHCDHRVFVKSIVDQGFPAHHGVDSSDAGGASLPPILPKLFEPAVLTVIPISPYLQPVTQCGVLRFMSINVHVFGNAMMWYAALVRAGGQPRQLQSDATAVRICAEASCGLPPCIRRAHVSATHG